MMTTAAVVGLTTGKRLLSNSFCPSDLTEKLFSSTDLCPSQTNQFSAAYATNSPVVAKKHANFGQNMASNRHTQAIKALKEYVHVASPSSYSCSDSSDVSSEYYDFDIESSLETVLLLQKSMLEKQWILAFDQTEVMPAGENHNQAGITRSGLSARQRRVNTRRSLQQNVPSLTKKRHPDHVACPELLQKRLAGYVRGTISENLLSHAEVITLSKMIKVGLSLDEHKSKLKEKLGCEPSDKQLASSLRMPLSELHSKIIECSLAREKLAMSNVRLVLSVAHKYDNMGAELSDLVQGGLIGLLRGIEKFDSSRGFRISTYVYWWIRQGVSRALVENSRILRLPRYLHERLFSIRNAKVKLEENGVVPSVDKLCESMNMSRKKVRSAMEAVSKVLSLDREAFPSINGHPGETLHSYIADNHLENSPWHGVDELSLKEEVSRLLCAALTKRERNIIHLYYGLDKESHTWEEISRQIGLSRERVRQIGLVALEKLKHAARKMELEAMLVKH